MPAAFGAIATGAAAGVAGGLSTTGILLNIGLSLALTGLQYLLQDKPSEQKNNIKQAIKSAITPVRYVLGRARLAGVLAYINTRRRDDRTVDMVFLLSEGRCGEIEKLWANGTEVRFDRIVHEDGKYIEYRGKKSSRISTTLRVNGAYRFVPGRSQGDRTGTITNSEPHYILELSGSRQIHSDYGSGVLTSIVVYESGNIALRNTRFNEDVSADLTLISGNNRVTITDDQAAGQLSISDKDAVKAFYQQLNDGDVGNADLVLGEGKDFTDKIKVFLYNNPDNLSTNGISLREAQPQEWTNEHQLRGITWCHVVLTQPAYGRDLDKRFWRNIPEIEVVLQGKYLTWVNQLVPTHTDNAAAIRYWYRRERLGTPNESIDATSVSRAFDRCEEEVEVTLPNEYSHFPNRHKRYTIDGIISSGDDPETILFEMDQAWQGNEIYRDGKYYFSVGEEPDTFETIDTDKIIDVVQIQPAPPLQDRINSSSIILSQAGPVNDWAELHLPAIRDNDAIRRDGELRHHNLGTRQFISDPVSAGRLMSIALRRARATMRISYNFMPFTNFVLGRYYKVTDPIYGLVDFKLRCESIVLNVDWTVTVTFSEYISGTYADVLHLPPLVPRDIRLPIRGKSDVPTPSNLTINADYQVSEDNNLRWFMDISWAPTDDTTSLAITGPNGWIYESEPINNYINVFVPRIGLYTIFISHRSNQGRQSETIIRPIQVGFNTVPNSPIDFNIVAVDTSYVIAEWKPDETGFPTIGYEVQYSIDGTGVWFLVDDERIARVIHIANLVEDTTYRFRIRAYNNAGNSIWFESDPVRTLSSTTILVPNVPRNLMVVSIGTTNIGISWDAPIGSIVSGYTVEYRRQGDIVWITHLNNVLIGGTIITGLTANTPYEIRVNAVNSAGAGVSSEILVASIEVPGIPESLRLDYSETDTIGISWMPPTSGGLVTDYDVQYRVQGTITWITNAHIGTELNDVIENLQGSTNYEIQVRANNALGNGNWTDSLVVRTVTVSQVPGQPTNLRQTYSTVSGFIIEWDAPLTGLITDYDIQYRLMGATDWIDFDADIININQSVLISSLNGNASYEVRVRAKNDNDIGEWSDIFTAMTLNPAATTPGIPRNVSLDTATQTSLVIEWDSPLSGGPVSGYGVQYRQIGDLSWINYSGTIDGLSVTLSNLSAGTSYEIRVRSLGQVSGTTSIWTTPVTFETISDSLTANAGLDQSVKNADVVYLTGTSTGGNINNHTYEWRQLSGTSVTLVNSASSVAIFLAPHSFNAQTLRFRLTVTDGTLIDSDEIEISVAARPAVITQSGKGPTVEPFVSSDGYRFCFIESSANNIWGNRPGRTFTWANATGDFAADDRQDDIVGPLSNEHLLWFRSALLKWTDICNVSFSEVADAADIDLRVGYATFSSTGTIAKAFGALNPLDNGVFIGFSANLFNRYRARTPEHEIGHFLGLWHPDGAYTDAIMETLSSLGGTSVVMPLYTDMIGMWHLYGPSTNAPNVAPDVIRNFNVTPGIEQVTIEWDPPSITGGSAITSYTLYRKSPTNQITTVNVSGTSYIHTNLTAHDLWEYWVIANNAQGSGIPSERIAKFVLDSTGTAPNPIETSIMWDDTDLSIFGGFISFDVYNSQFPRSWIVDNASAYMGSFSLDSNGRATLILNDKPRTSNDIGTDEGPHFVNRVRQNILMRLVGDDDGDDDVLLLEGIQDDTVEPYSWAPTNQVDLIAWVGRRYNGEEIELTFSYTDPMIASPAAPTNLRQTGMLTTTISLAWDAPSSLLNLNGYEVQYRRIGNTIWIPEQHIGTHVTELIIGLVIDSTYEVRVRSIGPGGTSAWLGPVEMSTAAGAEAPEPPTNLRVQGTPTKNTIGIQWNAPTDTTDLTGYEIEYKTNSETDYTSFMHAGTTTQAIITDLIEDTSYQIRVRATGPGGESTWLGPITLDTAENRLPSLPNFGTYQAVVDTALNVTLLSAAQLAAVGGDGNKVYSLTNEPSWLSLIHGTTLRLTGTPDTEDVGTTLVTLTVTDVDGDDDSETFNIVVSLAVQIPSVPATPTLVSRTETSLTVKVVAIDGATEYEWRYSTNNVVTDSDPKVTSQSNEITITNLTAGTDYWIDCRAKNSAGNSAYSSDLATSTIMEVLDPPGLPTALTVTGNTSSGFTFSWTAPTDGTEVASYDVEYRRAADDMYTDANHTGLTTSIALSGLDSGTSYYVRVRAVGTNGVASNWVEKSTATVSLASASLRFVEDIDKSSTLATLTVSEDNDVPDGFGSGAFTAISINHMGDIIFTGNASVTSDVRVFIVFSDEGSETESANIDNVSGTAVDSDNPLYNYYRTNFADYFNQLVDGEELTVIMQFRRD